MAGRNASRLPVLVIAAAYRAAGKRIGEKVKPLRAHNAADAQTAALGDVEIELSDEGNVVTCFEVKSKPVTSSDILTAVKKLAQAPAKPDNYLFVTTEPVDESVSELAKSIYQETGVEIAILDCNGFLHFFLHFYHRKRVDFLEAYQELLVSEPESAVGRPLKEAFLALRLSAESED